MSRYLIRRDGAKERWSVFRTGEFARYVTSFDSLHEAEQYVIDQGDDT